MFPRLTLSIALLGSLSIPALAITDGSTPAPLRDLHAVNLVEEVGGAERVNLSGKLRMLSQRIPAAACNAEAGIAPETSAPMLAAATAEFEQIVTGLEVGDDTLGLPTEETNRKVLADLAAVRDVWNPLHGKLGAMIDAGPTHESVQAVAATSADLLARAAHMVSVISGVHSDPAALLQADALTIDIAGRQRMLAQRISKNACLIQAGIETEAARSEMISAIDTYAVSVMALRNGMPDAGIVPPPSDAIADGLDEIIANWTALQPLLQKVSGGDALDTDARATIFNGMNGLTGKMNTLVGMYASESKLGL